MTKKMKIILGLVVAAGVVAGAISYKNANTTSPEIQEVEEAEKLNPVGPAFNADSALAYCAAQCDFGPRVMNSEAHDKCGEWIVSKFKQFGCEVETQKADLKEYALLHLFLEHPEEVLARERIMKDVWDTDDLLESRTIDMHVRTLRQKLGAAGEAIRTVRKVGYKLSTEGSDD
jgi:hypothetical protein